MTFPIKKWTNTELFTDGMLATSIEKDWDPLFDQRKWKPLVGSLEGTIALNEQLREPEITWRAVWHDF